MQNTNDLKREQQSKPSAGYSTDRHAKKGDLSSPSAGTVDHPNKIDRCGGEISKPSAGPHDRGKDPKNASKPDGGDADVPKDHEHLDKHAFEKARKHEPRPKGDTNSGGQKFQSSKRD